jgi:surface antigen
MVPAYGQFFPSLDFGLNAEDISIIDKATTPLFSTDAVGQSEAWANPRTGNKGIIVLRKIYGLKGMPCRQLEFQIAARGEKIPSRIVTDWCQIATGEWKLVDPAELESG